VKILLFGSYGLLMESVIVKLHKEGHELFVVTGRKLQEEHHEGTIDAYFVEYGDSSLYYVFESVKPDAVICTGAFDELFHWKEQTDSAKYLAGFNNILISAIKSKVSKFIYFSTTDVYDMSMNGKAAEHTVSITTGSLREMTMRSAEDLVMRYKTSSKTKFTILRCSDIYGECNGQFYLDSFLMYSLKTALMNNTVFVERGKNHNLIYVQDVTEALVRVLKQEELPHIVYNIASEEYMSEEEFLDYYQEFLAKRPIQNAIDAVNPSTGEISCELAEKDWGFSVRGKFKQIFPEIFRKFKIYLDSQSGEVKKKGIFGQIRDKLRATLKWFYPYVECIAAFLVFFLLDRLTLNIKYFDVIDFYILYVALIAIVYGKGKAIIAIVLSFLGRLINYGGLTGQGRTMIDYNTYIWVLQLLILGMSIGYVRDNDAQKLEDEKENTAAVSRELVDVKEINNSNVRIKQVYEERLLNYKDSFARIYSIVTQLNDLEPDKIMLASIDVVQKIMNVTDVAIYNVGKGSYYGRLAATSRNMTGNTKKSFRLEDMGDVYEEIKEHRIFMNTQVDPQKPDMAGGVYHGEVLEALILIQNVPFENMTLYHSNLFAVLLNLIAQSMHTASIYLEESALSRYMPNTRILNARSFERILQIQEEGQEQKNTEFFVMEVINDENKSLEELDSQITSLLRQHDYLGVDEEGRLFILVTNTNKAEARFVVERLEGKGIHINRESLEQEEEE
jgi:nucleoside-diphosphate-sugar epimerase